MPIISNYDPLIGNGGGTISGGSFNNAPYPYCFVRFIPIPVNEKFLLIPAKPESREIDIQFNQPVELYFGFEEIPFKLLPSTEKYKDNQLGVNLSVKTEELNCQCLLVIRSERVIDYITSVPTPSPTPIPQNWAIIAPDNLSVFIDPSKFQGEIQQISLIIPNYLDIPNYQFFEFLNAIDLNNPDSIYSGGGKSLQRWENGGTMPDYPIGINDYIIELYSNASKIKFYISNSENSLDLKILYINFETNTFTLGI